MLVLQLAEDVLVCGKNRVASAYYAIVLRENVNVKIQQLLGSITEMANEFNVNITFLLLFHTHI